MTSQEFRALCNRIFIEYGFVKKGKDYYIDLGSDIVGSNHVQLSNYGKAIYLNCGFSLKNANEHMPYPKHTEVNMCQRIAVPGREKLANKPETHEYLTEMIKYELYNQNEMENFLKEGLDSWVVPAIKNGMSLSFSMRKCIESCSKSQGCSTIFQSNALISDCGAQCSRM